MANSNEFIFLHHNRKKFHNKYRIVYQHVKNVAPTDNARIGFNGHRAIKILFPSSRLEK